MGEDTITGIKYRDGWQVLAVNGKVAEGVNYESQKGENQNLD